MESVDVFVLAGNGADWVRLKVYISSVVKIFAGLFMSVMDVYHSVWNPALSLYSNKVIYPLL